MIANHPDPHIVAGVANIAHLRFSHTDTLLPASRQQNDRVHSLARDQRTSPPSTSGGRRRRSLVLFAHLADGVGNFNPQPSSTMSVTFFPSLFEQRQMWVLGVLRRENVKAVRNLLLSLSASDCKCPSADTILHAIRTKYYLGAGRRLWRGRITHRIMQPRAMARHPRPRLDRALQNSPRRPPPRSRHL